MGAGYHGGFGYTYGNQEYHGSPKNTVSGNKFKEAAKESVKKLIKNTPGSRKKAMAVGAYDSKTGKTVAAFAGEIPKRIHPLLKKRAEEIGGIGSLGVTKRNTVGVCAEFHVVNSLLLGGAKWSDIHLIQPIRPRTGQKMPFCDNCKTMFADLIDN